MITKTDFAILDFIQNNLSNNVLNYIMKYITHLGDAGILWIVITVILLCFKKTRKAGVYVGLSILITAFIGNVVLKNIFCRVRPFIAANHPIIINPPMGFSFPSGHTSSSFAAATALGLIYKKYAPYCYVVAILISFSRIYLYVHFPSDIIGGAVLGIGIAVVTKYLFNKILNARM